MKVSHANHHKGPLHGGVCRNESAPNRWLIVEPPPRIEREFMSNVRDRGHDNRRAARSAQRRDPAGTHDPPHSCPEAGRFPSRISAGNVDYCAMPISTGCPQPPTREVGRGGRHLEACPDIGIPIPLGAGLECWDQTTDQLPKTRRYRPIPCLGSLLGLRSEI